MGMPVYCVLSFLISAPMWLCQVIPHRPDAFLHLDVRMRSSRMQSPGLKRLSELLKGTQPSIHCGCDPHRQSSYSSTGIGDVLYNHSNTLGCGLCWHLRDATFGRDVLCAFSRLRVARPVSPRATCLIQCREHSVELDRLYSCRYSRYSFVRRPMRSRIIQPRTLFRIGGSSSSASTSAATATARTGPNCSSSGATTGVTGASRQLRQTHSIHANNLTPLTHARCGSSTRSISTTKSASTLAGASNGKHGLNSGANNRGGNNAQSSPSSSSSPPSSSSTSVPRSSKAQQNKRPVFPVHPPPHSSRSVALQSFFSQGRPLLEHNNLDFGLSESGIPGMGAKSAGSIAMVVEMEPQEEEDADLESDADFEERETLKAQLMRAGTGFSEEQAEELARELQQWGQKASHGSREELSNAETTGKKSVGEAYDAFSPEMQAKIRAHANALLESMLSIAGQLSKVDVSKGHTLDTPLPWTISSLSSDASTSIVSMEYHLPSLRSLTTATFNKIIENAMASSQQRKNPLSMHTLVSMKQAFERSRRHLMNEALSSGEDPTLASALGPESELVVVGDPKGPRAEWGRGVASHLARHGRPYQVPDAPQGGEDAARTQRLEDSAEYMVADFKPQAQQQGVMSIGDLSESDEAHSHVSMVTPTEEGDDVEMWLSHAMVQNKIKSDVAWSRVASAMEGKRRIDTSTPTSKEESSLNALLSMTSLKATLPSASIDDLLKRREEAEKDEEEVIRIINMDSVKRKRKKKMRKMKYKKLRKRQRAERQRLKK